MKIEPNFKLLVGHIQFVDIETGYWQLVDNDDKYRISNISDNLKHDKLKIAAMVEIIENEMSIFMSGKSIKIIEYKIIN